MGYVTIISRCYCCQKLFTYNPLHVPSVRDANDVRQPLCASCVRQIQEKQREQGIEVWPDPHPEAYEPLPEHELP